MKIGLAVAELFRADRQRTNMGRRIGSLVPLLRANVSNVRENKNYKYFYTKLKDRLLDCDLIA
jgi:hypothetical protein